MNEEIETPAAPTAAAALERLRLHRLRLHQRFIRFAQDLADITSVGEFEYDAYDEHGTSMYEPLRQEILKMMAADLYREMDFNAVIPY
jgi:hypothetical protein